MRIPRLISLVCLICTPLLAADEYRSAEEAGSLTVKGDSTLHKWEASTGELKGGLSLEDNEITSLEVSIPVETLKSGKDGLDDKMYDAMKTGKFPRVGFVLTKSEKPEENPDGMTGEVRLVTGDLTILDTTQSVTVPVAVATDENGQLALSGSRELDMTDFGVKPPKAMLGMVKAHPKITVDFTWILDKKGNGK